MSRQPRRRVARYRATSRFYDAISAEWPVYRAGRVAAIGMLELRPGDRVLDIGCGTGLNFPHLQRRIGATGEITAVDASGHMLAQARRRVRRAGWANVRLFRGDAAVIRPADIGAAGSSGAVPGADTRFDAALSTYALSLIPHWQQAVATMIGQTRPGGHVGVVDMQKPTGRAALLTPLAQLACLLGGSDIDAHPWTGIEEALTDVRAASARGGHIQVRVGSTGG